MSRNKKKNYLLISVIAFLIALVSAFYTVFFATKKVISNVETVLGPRTGEEIYSALLDKPQTSCVKILDYLDQEIPIMDYAIALHFTTCPQEFQRIISKRNFSVGREAGSEQGFLLC